MVELFFLAGGRSRPFTAQLPAPNRQFTGAHYIFQSTSCKFPAIRASSKEPTRPLKNCRHLPRKAPDSWQWLENRPAKMGLLMISTAAPYLAGYRKAFDAEAKRLNLEVIASDANNDPARQAARPKT